MTSLDQMLSYAGSKIAHMSDEFLKHRDKLPFEDIKTMTKELKKTKQNLSHILGREDIPNFDTTLISSILSFINKIKKTTPHEAQVGKRRTQKGIFLDELVELQGVLKILRSKGKSSTSEGLPGKRKSVIKIEGIKRKGSELDEHLIASENKLNALKRSVIKGSKIPQSQYKEITTALKRANNSLVKAKAIQKSFSGQYKPDYDKKVIKKIFQEIKFFQDLIGEAVRAGTVHMQINLFWYTLREFQTLLKDLEALKKIRGKAVAAVQTDMAR